MPECMHSCVDTRQWNLAISWGQTEGGMVSGTKSTEKVMEGQAHAIQATGRS